MDIKIAIGEQITELLKAKGLQAAACLRSRNL